MSFDSLHYLLYLPLVYLLYRLLPHTGQNRMLLVAGYYFYGCWDIRFLSLIMLSTAVDFSTGLLIERGTLSRRHGLIVASWATLGALVFVAIDWSALLAGDTNAVIDPIGVAATLGIATFFLACWLLQPRFAALPDERRRRVALVGSLVVNLGILGFFKYFNFFIGSFEQLAASLGLGTTHWHLDVVLPVGLSFYTFQSMSYALDIYRRKMRAAEGFLDFALFVSFFPQLVAGPIERAAHLLPLITGGRRVALDQSLRGLYLILLGLFKKVAIANGVAGSVDSIYNSAQPASFGDVTAATLLFAVQIYCDFSGYTDIARGSAKLLGIDLIENFKLPYFSTNPSEFWRRWHISLSTWLRDYLYISLGGNRGSRAQTYRNLMITMLLGGLWHGAAWNFVLWGFFHGAILCIHRVITGGREPTPNRWLPLKIALFFAVTCYGWLLFRANSFEQVFAFSRTLLSGPDGLALTVSMPTFAALVGLPLLILLELIEYKTGDALFYRRLPPVFRGAFYAVLVFVVILGMSNAPTQFIYFQF
jgi:alginate O-acetyltransferase complex protein AlgI